MATRYTNLLIEMVEAEILDATEVVKMLCKGISEEDVRKIFLANQLDEGVPSDLMANWDYNDSQLIERELTEREATEREEWQSFDPDC